MSADDDRLFEAVDTAIQFGLSKSVEHVSAPVVGPGAAKTLGHGTKAVYKHLPDEVKAGAGLGGFVAVYAGTHMMTVGTAGCIAAGTAAIAATPVLVTVGAVLGGGWWLINQLKS